MMPPNDKLLVAGVGIIASILFLPGALVGLGLLATAKMVNEVDSLKDPPSEEK